MSSKILSKTTICLMGFVALASAANPPSDASRDGEGPEEGSKDFCAASSTAPCHAPSRSGLLHQGSASSSYLHYDNDTFQKPQPGRSFQPHGDLTLWMFVEFLKAAPLVMGLGCIMTIFVALRQKWLDLPDSEKAANVRWTKPVTC